MPFESKNAAQIFQRFMHSLFRDLEFVYCYVDDILIASKTSENYRKHLKTVFKRLQEDSITINLSKCKLSQKQVDFIGFQVAAEDIKLASVKINALINFLRPGTRL